MLNQSKIFQLSHNPDPYHHYRVLLYSLGALLILTSGSGIGYLFGTRTIQNTQTIPNQQNDINIKQAPSIPPSTQANSSISSSSATITPNTYMSFQFLPEDVVPVYQVDIPNNWSGFTYAYRSGEPIQTAFGYSHQKEYSTGVEEGMSDWITIAFMPLPKSMSVNTITDSDYSQLLEQYYFFSHNIELAPAPFSYMTIDGMHAVKTSASTIGNDSILIIFIKGKTVYVLEDKAGGAPDIFNHMLATFRILHDPN